jgi:glycine cleavage system aminomethyltransferase T
MGQTPPAIEDHRTPLAALGIASGLQMHFGQLTPQAFEDCALELGHLMHAAAIYDLGYRTRIRITGRDRVRWLNGMVSNNVRDMAEGSVLYTFVLNAQGRIQGDGHVFRSAEDFLMETDRLQAPRLLKHLNQRPLWASADLRPSRFWNLSRPPSRKICALCPRKSAVSL